MKRILKALPILGIPIAIIAALLLQQAHSAAFTFNQNRIIDDGVFNNSGSMTAGQIDAFLNQFPNSCISPNNNFQSRDPTGYSPSGGFTYGGNVTAGQVIYDSAKAYDLNPQVLLATLQKEQSLVDGTAGCSVLRYTGAMGYGCPDGGTSYNYSGVNLYTLNGTTVTAVNDTCVNTSLKAGFTQQVIRGAWLLKFGEQRSEGNINWAIVRGSWDNSDDPQSCYSGPMTQGTWQRCPSGGSATYDGYTTIDGTAVHMDNGATATLYWYTPHFHGNQSFFTIFTGWFGSTHVPDYSWQLTGQYAYTDDTKTTAVGLDNLLPGQRVFIGFTAKNIGNVTWTNTGANPVDVGTLVPTDRVSPFYDATWLGYGRPARLKEASVEPDQTGTFEFWITAPSSNIGNFSEHFGLVAEGQAWFPNIGLYFGIYAQPPRYTWQLTGQYAYTDNTQTTAVGLNNLEPGDRRYIGFTAKNTGNVTWTNTGPHPLDVGTINPTDRVSPFYDVTWLGYGRPARMLEASVAPGQTATFEFWITAPATSYGSFTEYFDPLIEGQAWLQSIGFNYAISVVNPSYSWQLTGQYAYTDATKTTATGLDNLSVGQTAYIGLLAKNTGNVTWRNTGASPVDLGTANPFDRMSVFCSSGTGWLGCNRPARMKESSVAPGQTATFEFLIKAPASPGTYREYFSPVAEGRSWFPNIGFNYLITVH